MNDIKRAILLNPEEQFEVLKEMDGERVRVHIALSSEEFGCQIAVHGDLEGRFVNNQPLWRVLSTHAKDRGADYAYFRSEDVAVIADRRQTEKGAFDGGAYLAIYLKGTTTHPYADQIIETVNTATNLRGGGKSRSALDKVLDFKTNLRKP